MLLTSLVAISLTAVQSLDPNSSGGLVFLQRHANIAREDEATGRISHLFMPERRSSSSQIISLDDDSSDIMFGSQTLVNQVEQAYADAKSLLPKEDAAPLAVCTMVRNEALYLEEWIAFLRRQGVDAFYLLNDRSSDATADIIRRGKAVGVQSLSTDIITDADYIPIAPAVFDGGADKQVAFLNACVRYAEQDQGRPTWVINIDVDEFLLPSDSNGPTFAQVFHQMRLNEVYYLHLQRLLVGSSGHVFNDGRPLTERFQWRMSPDAVAEECSHTKLAFGRVAWKLCENYKDNTYGKFAVFSKALEGVHTPHVATIYNKSGTSMECGLTQGCRLVVYHYQLKSLMEFMLRTDASSWRFKYGADPEEWFETFDRAGNKIFDDVPARLFGPWKLSLPAPPPRPALKDTAATLAIYGEEFVSQAFGAPVAKRELPAGVLLLGMHQSGTSAAARLMLSLGLWGGEPSDFDENSLMFWERKDVVELNQGLFDAQHGDRSSASWTGLGFDLKSARMVDISAWGQGVQPVMQSLSGLGMPFVTKDPRMSLMLPLWMDLMRGHARPVCALMWRDLEVIGNAIERQKICTGKKNTNGTCQNMVPKGDIVDLGGHYVMEAIKGCDGVPTVVLQHKKLQNMASFISEAHSQLLTAIPGIGLSKPEKAAGLVQSLTLLRASDSEILPVDTSAMMPSISWRNVQTIAIGEVMNSMVSQQEGKWSSATPLDLAGVIRDEINARVEEYQGFIRMGPMRRDPFGRKGGNPNDQLSLVEQKGTRVSQYTGKVWLVWTTSADSFGWLQRVVLESLFRHNPYAKVFMCSDAIVDVVKSGIFPGHTKVIRQLSQMGYHIEVSGFPTETLQAYIKDTFDPKAEMAYSHLTDLWRYHVLYNHGGIYMDFDVVVTNPLFNLPGDNFLHYQYDGDSAPPSGSKASELYRSNDTSTWLMNTAFMGFEKNHAFMRRLLEVAKDYHNATSWTCIGNEMFQAELPNYAGKNFSVVPMIAAAPMSWDKVARCANPDDATCNERCSRNFKGGWVFHTYNRAMPGKGEEANFDPASCLGRLVSEHRIEFSDA